MASSAAPVPRLPQQVLSEQVRAHYLQIPAMVIAPSLGGLFTAWVLWDAVDNRVLVLGMAAVIGLSAVRLLVYRRYLRASATQADAPGWRRFAVLASLLSGLVWGSAAPLLYPPRLPGYEVFLLVLLTLLPIVPVAALAVYMPAFYAYYLPCMAPFIATLALQGSRPEQMAALLLVMMLAAMLTFARKYSHSLGEAIRLRLVLAEQSQALAAAVQHKTRFIATASHDLRQPVHAMGLFLASMQARRDDSEDGRLIGHIGASLRNLRGMLTNMLDLSRLDADVVRPQPQDFQIADLLHRLQQEFSPLAAQKGLGLQLRASAGLVRADPALLERMLRNLLANALKFTHRGGIALTCRVRGTAVLLRVHDSGIGIRREDAGRIFDEFTQLAPADASDASGLGLGLAIVQRAARLQGLALRLRSTPGRGSVFSLVLPCSPPGTQAPADAADLAPALLAPKQVLVIDDDVAVAAGAALLLRHWGHQALVCQSADEACGQLARSGAMPDLLIVDFRLAAGQSGLQAATRVRQALGRPLPVILITGDTEPQRIREAFEAGHLLLHKPVDPQRLQACMAALLADPGPAAVASL